MIQRQKYANIPWLMTSAEINQINPFYLACELWRHIYENFKLWSGYDLDISSLEHDREEMVDHFWGAPYYDFGW